MPPKSPIQPRMTRRCREWDYTQPRIYMLTLTVEGRKALLGRLAGESAETAHVEASDLGRRVLELVELIHVHHPEVRVLGKALMPDHLHLIVYVTRKMEKPLGSVLAGFKYACNRAAEELALAAGPISGPWHDPDHTQRPKNCCEPRVGSASGQPKPNPSQPSRPYTQLWAKGYNDKILYGQGQLQHMIDYLRDNPRRLWVKRHNKDVFMQQHVTINGTLFTAMGNLDLLQHPLTAVHVRRIWTDSERRDHMNSYILQARNGTVLVGAFISPYERQVMQQAYTEKLPMIRLVENGFDPLYKPMGADFDECASGRLLLLSPWQHHNQRAPITRSQCNQLNLMAEALCKQQNIIKYAK